LTSLTRQPQSPHYDYTPSEGFMFVFIILWVRAEPSWMSFPLPINRMFQVYDTSHLNDGETP
ncbi:hypothetical protein, partial [Streptococcus parasuis]